MSRSDDEKRRLQDLVYGRGAAASEEDAARLEALQNGAGTDTAPGPGARSTADSGPTFAEESSPGILRWRDSSWRTRLTVIGVLAGTLGVGTTIGWATAHLAPKEPVAVFLPLDASRYDSESIVYFGERQGLRIWTAKLMDASQDCLIAIDLDGAGTANCMTAGSGVATVDLPARSDGPSLRVSVDFSTEIRPEVTRRSP